MSRALGTISLMAIALIAACGPSKLEQRVNSLDETVASIQRDQALAASRLEESNRLNQSVYLLQDRVEQMAVVLERMQSGVPDPAAEVPSGQPSYEAPKLRALPPNAKSPARQTPAPKTQARASEQPAVEDPVTTYRKAYDLLMAGLFDESSVLFQALVAAYPKHDLADNAYYWLGETDYARKNFRGAIAHFQTVVETYPNGNKVPDALLKMGYSYQELGQLSEAKQTLQRLIKNYPWSGPAEKAKERLQSLG